MTQRLDIAVCGCGPAGLAAALLLHRSGHRVRIFERFATPQPVGSGLLLQPTGLGVLHELGLSQRILELGARIDRLYGLEPVIEPGQDAGSDTLESFVEVNCPYCAESIQLRIDVAAGDQSYIEDCQVCCQAIQIGVTLADDGTLESVSADRLDL